MLRDSTRSIGLCIVQTCSAPTSASIKPLYVDWNPQNEDLTALKTRLAAGLEQYRADYAAYYEAHKRPDSPAMAAAASVEQTSYAPHDTADWDAAIIGFEGLVAASA